MHNVSSCSPCAATTCCCVCAKVVPASFASADPSGAGAAATCSLRCSWRQRLACCQCGRNIAGNTAAKAAIFCGAACADEARRGNWCVLCGCRPSAAAGRCGLCSSATGSAPASQPVSAQLSRRNSGVFEMNTDESPFPSRKTSPEEAMSKAQRAGGSGGGKPQRTCSVVYPDGGTARVYERIAAPFIARGLHVAQIIQLNGNPQEKKAYNANRLAVDQRMAAGNIAKLGFGGEGNEHKRFVPLLSGCCAAFAAPSGIVIHGGNNDGVPATLCCDGACDACRIMENGMKLSSIVGRTSHFSVPNFDSVLPWCLDAGKPSDNGAARLCAVALTRVVVGHPLIVHDLSQVAPPPIGYDSVLCMDRPGPDGAAPQSDSCFSFSDHSVQAEYIVFFAAPQQPALTAAPSAAAAASQQQQPQQRHGEFVAHSNFGGMAQQNFCAPARR